MTGPLELGSQADGAAAGFAGPPGAVALAAALGDLLVACRDVTDAVTRHDRAALEAANARSESILAEVGRLTSDLTSVDRPFLAELGVPGTCEALAATSRRNAFLIEQAWSIDAALMRELISAGTAAAAATTPGYGSAPGPTYVNRGA